MMDSGAFFRLGWEIELNGGAAVMRDVFWVESNTHELCDDQSRSWYGMLGERRDIHATMDLITLIKTIPFEIFI